MTRSHKGKPKPKPTRISADELALRARLREQIASLSGPAFGADLTRREKASIALHVRSGKIAQSLFPRGGARGTREGG